ncbi:MAG: aminoacyl-tRNA hydrolase [Opitutaceae bacterium]|jgi:PTH1 family peptidyl-tRNA hydrolase|nr:aminoacyl-tRNA hydrolase [Opitutaceae bacterium]
MSITLVAGLGNPGREYRDTRHNLGCAVVDALAREHGLAWKMQTAFQSETARWESAPGPNPVLLAKPLTYMNDSGRALQALASFHKLPVASVIVIYDDLNIDLGLVKVSLTGGAGGHNGIASVLRHLGDGFIRYRLGTGPRHPAHMDLKDFVLGKFTTDQQITIARALTHYLHGLRLLLEHGAARAMNTLNRRNNNNSSNTNSSDSSSTTTSSTTTT